MTPARRSRAARRRNGRYRVLPVNGFEDYFKLHDAGKLRGRYLLTMDANERGAVILIGDQPTMGALGMRGVRTTLGLSEVTDKKARFNLDRAARRG